MKETKKTPKNNIGFFLWHDNYSLLTCHREGGLWLFCNWDAVKAIAKKTM